jgi:hypothetical protein
MFERFTDRARRVVVLAQEEARLLGHNWIGTEHLLLGMLHEGEGVAAKVLTNLGVDLESVRAEVEQIIGRGGDEPVVGHVPFTPRAKKVLELSLREALQLAHNYIGTEHILLGLVREGEGVAAQVLQKRGLTLDRVRGETIRLLSGMGPPVRTTARRGPQKPLTPAATRATDEAQRLAGDHAVGTHHLLRALLGEPDSLAAKALAELGVTKDAVEAKLTALDAPGTSDELPEEAGARRTSLQVLGDKVAVLIDDAAIRERLKAGLQRYHNQFVLAGTDPAARSFPKLWESVNEALADVLARIERSGPAVGPDWRPPEWKQGWEVAAYAVVSTPAGILSHLEVAEGVDREAVRAGLAAWLTANQKLAEPGDATYLSVVVDRADEPGGWGVVRQCATGMHGERKRVPSSLLVAYAIVELTGEGDAPAATG